MPVFVKHYQQFRRHQFTLPSFVFIVLALVAAPVAAQDSSLGSSKEQREAFDARNQQIQELEKTNAMLQQKRERRNRQLSTDTMTPEVRAAWNRYEQKSYPSTASGTQQAERDFLMLQSNWGAVQAEAHKGNIRPVDATRFSQEHKQAMSARGNAAAKQVDPSLEVEAMPVNPNAKDKPYSDHDGQLRGAVVDNDGTRAPVTAEQAANTRSQFDKNVNTDLRKHGLPELENPSATMKTDAMVNTPIGRDHRASAEHQNRKGGTVYQDPVAKDMELKNQKFDADGVSEAQKSNAMDKARYANEQGRQQDIHRRKQDRELARGLELVNDNPDTNSAKHKAGLEALQNSQAQGDYGAKYTERLNKTVDQASKNAKTNHGVDTEVSPKLKASVEKLKTDRTVNATVESATAAANYENNQANKRSQGAQIFAQDGEHKAAAEMVRNANANTKGETIESVRVGAAQRKEAELLSSGASATEARRQAQSYGDSEAGKLAAEMRDNSKRDVMHSTEDNFELNSKELADTNTPEQPDTKTRVFGAAKIGMDATIAVGTGVKATDDYIKGSEAEALANESQARFDAINKKEVLTKDETDQALAESKETLKQRTEAGKKGDAAKGAVTFGGQMAGMVAGEATEGASAAVGVALDSYDAGSSAHKTADAYNREQRLRAKAAELNAKGLTEQAQKFTDRADKERETKLTELEKTAASAGKTGLGVATAAGAGTVMQGTAAVASLPAAAVAGAAAGAFGSGYGATRTVIENTKAGKTLEDAKADYIAGKDAVVIATEGTAASQHERLKGFYESRLDSGEYALGEGFDRNSYESAMAKAKESGSYGYVRGMLEKVPEEKPPVGVSADTTPMTPRVAKTVGDDDPDRRKVNLDAQDKRPVSDMRSVTQIAEERGPGEPDRRKTGLDAVDRRPVSDLRDEPAVVQEEAEDYTDFDPAAENFDPGSRSGSGSGNVARLEEPEDFSDFDPAASSATSFDDELESLVSEMAAGHEQATRQLDAQKRTGSAFRRAASLERTGAALMVTNDTQTIRIASAQAAQESQRNLYEQADQIAHEQKARVAEQERQRVAAQQRQKAAAQQRYEEQLRQTTVSQVPPKSTTSTSSIGSSSRSSGSAQTAANTQGLSAACRESETLARQLADLEPRARAGDKNALAQFQSLAKRSQSVQAACQKSLPIFNAPMSSDSLPAYEGDECGPVIYGIPKTKEECDSYKANR